MKKRTKIIIISVGVVIIIVSNIPPIKYITRMLERDKGIYTYGSKNTPNSFFSEHGLGPDRLVYFQWKEDTSYIREHPESLKDTFYRTFYINPLCFWRWGDYLFDERYTLPYKSKEDIKKIWEAQKGMIVK